MSARAMLRRGKDPQWIVGESLRWTRKGEASGGRHFRWLRGIPRLYIMCFAVERRRSNLTRLLESKGRLDLYCAVRFHYSGLEATVKNVRLRHPGSLTDSFQFLGHVMFLDSDATQAKAALELLLVHHLMYRVYAEWGRRGNRKNEFLLRTGGIILAMTMGVNRSILSRNLKRRLKCVISQES